MKTIIKRSLQSLLFVPMLALGVSTVMPIVQSAEVSAQSALQEVRDGASSAGGDATEPNFFDEGGLFRQIVNALLFIIGAIAVIMIIFGGFKYVTSAGDSSGVTSAKNTILYAVVGLIVAVLAFAIIDFVLDSLGE